MKNEKGYILLVTLMTLVFISIIGFSLFTLTQTTHSQSTNERKDQSVFYVAEAGINIKEARLVKLINQAYLDSKASEPTFEQTFNSKLTTILNSEKNSVYDNSVFNSEFNGKPNATVSIQYDPINPRSFKIISTGTLIGTKQERSVEKAYTIPTTLVQKTTIQQPVESPGSQPNLPIPGPNLDDFSITGTATNYFSNRIEIHSLPKKDLNMKTYTNFERKTSTTLLSGDLIYKNSSNITFNSGYKNLTPFTINHDPTPIYTSANTELDLSPNLQTLTKNMFMPIDIGNDLFNKKEHVFNIHTDHNVAIIFSANRLYSNLNNIRFNVTGSGTLNIVFQKSYQLDEGRKFVVDTKNTNVKVNIIFENFAHLFGELQAQNIYLSGSGDLNVHTGGKLIANNIFINNGNFIKQPNSSVKIQNLSIKEGHLNVYAGGGVRSNHIQMLKGNANISGKVNVVSKSFSVINGELKIPIYSCLQSKDIYVKNGRIDLGGTMLYNYLSAHTFSAYAPAEVNTKTSCNLENITIIPPSDIPSQQYINIDQYLYLHDSDYLQTHPLIEID